MIRLQDEKPSLNTDDLATTEDHKSAYDDSFELEIEDDSSTSNFQGAPTVNTETEDTSQTSTNTPPLERYSTARPQQNSSNRVRSANTSNRYKNHAQARSNSRVNYEERREVPSIIVVLVIAQVLWGMTLIGFGILWLKILPDQQTTEVIANEMHNAMVEAVKKNSEKSIDTSQISLKDQQLLKLGDDLLPKRANEDDSEGLQNAESNLIEKGSEFSKESVRTVHSILWWLSMTFLATGICFLFLAYHVFYLKQWAAIATLLLVALKVVTDMTGDDGISSLTISISLFTASAILGNFSVFQRR